MNLWIQFFYNWFGSVFIAIMQSLGDFRDGDHLTKFLEIFLLVLVDEVIPQVNQIFQWFPLSRMWILILQNFLMNVYFLQIHHSLKLKNWIFDFLNGKRPFYFPTRFFLFTLLGWTPVAMWLSFSKIAMLVLILVWSFRDSRPSRWFLNHLSR